MLKYMLGDIVYFNYDDKDYEIIITKKHNKNLYIRVGSDLKIKITAPYLYTKGLINKIINDNRNDIIKMIEKQKDKDIIKKDEYNSFLGSKINVCYENVNKPILDGNSLYIKDDDMLDKWYKKQAKEIFRIYLDDGYNMFSENIPYPKLKVRLMKSRWGVCNRRDNSVTLNLELIKKDDKYLKYVVIHELSHFVHFDHSKEFWGVVEKYCPNYKKIRKELK